MSNFDREAFWAAFGEPAPVEKVVKPSQFRKRFIKKIPDQCAKISVRVGFAAVFLTALFAAGYNPIRLLTRFIV